MLDASSGGSEVELHSQSAAGLHQAREPGGDERNIEDKVLCRYAQLVTVGQSSTRMRRYGEREDALSELCALVKRDFLEAHRMPLSIGTRWSEFVFCRIHVFLCTGGALFNSNLPLGLFASTSRVHCSWSLLHSSFFPVLNNTGEQLVVCYFSVGLVEVRCILNLLIL